MLESWSRQLAFSQFQQGDSGDCNIFEHRAWEFGEERVKQVPFLTPDGVPLEICRAVRTISQLDGAAQDPLLGVSEVVETLVQSNQSMQAIINTHSEDIQRVVTVGNNMGQFVEKISQVTESHAAFLNGVRSKLDEHEQCIGHVQQGIQGHERDLHGACEEYRSEIGELRNHLNSCVTHDALQFLLKEDRVYLESRSSRIDCILQEQDSKLEEGQTRCSQGISSMREALSNASDDNVNTKVIRQELGELQRKFDSLSQRFTQELRVICSDKQGPVRQLTSRIEAFDTRLMALEASSSNIPSTQLLQEFKEKISSMPSAHQILRMDDKMKKYDTIPSNIEELCRRMDMAGSCFNMIHSNSNSIGELQKNIPLVDGNLQKEIHNLHSRYGSCVASNDFHRFKLEVDTRASLLNSTRGVEKEPVDGDPFSHGETWVLDEFGRELSRIRHMIDCELGDDALVRRKELFEHVSDVVSPLSAAIAECVEDIKGDAVSHRSSKRVPIATAKEVCVRFRDEDSDDEVSPAPYSSLQGLLGKSTKHSQSVDGAPSRVAWSSIGGLSPCGLQGKTNSYAFNAFSFDDDSNASDVGEASFPSLSHQRKDSAHDQLRKDAQKIRSFFNSVHEGRHVEVDQLADLMGDTVGKREGRVRGVLRDHFAPSELRLLDEQAKKEIRRFLPRPKLDAVFLNWHVFRKQWKYYMEFWGSVMSPHLRTLTLLSCLPDESTDSYLKCLCELGGTYTDIWHEIKSEAKMLSNPVSLQTEWQKSRPECSYLQDYRDWNLQWSVLLKRLGGVPPEIAKTQYLHALLSCGFADSQLEKLYEFEDTQQKALILEACHNFIMPLLRTHRHFTVSIKRQGARPQRLTLTRRRCENPPR